MSSFFTDDTSADAVPAPGDEGESLVQGGSTSVDAVLGSTATP